MAGGTRRLFEAKSIYGIQPRGFLRRIQSEDDSDEAAEAHGNEDDVDVNEEWPAEVNGELMRSDQTKRDAEEPAREGQRQGLAKELGQDVPRSGADGHADADLPRPLSDADQHDVHDADASDEERDGSDGREEGREDGRALLLRLCHL